MNGKIVWRGRGWYAIDREGLTRCIARHLTSGETAAASGIARAYGMSKPEWKENL